VLVFVQSPHDASLLLRGIKTLAVRTEHQSDTAHHLAMFLSTHPAVRQVHYPGLPSHPQHHVAKRQMSKFGSMLSFVVVGGQAAAISVANVSLRCYFSLKTRCVSGLVVRVSDLSKLLTYGVLRSTQPPTIRRKEKLVAYGLRDEGLLWLIGAVVCLCAAPRVQLFVSEGNHGRLRDAPRYH